MSAPDPRHWIALEQLQALYAGIRTSNGYRTDIGARVLLEASQSRPENLPELLVTGRGPGVLGAGKAFSVDEMTVVLEGRVAADGATANRLAWRVHADLLQATPKKKLGRDSPLTALTSLEVVDADLLPRADGQPYISVQVVLRAGLVTFSVPAGT